jgi:8-hydroxy-5-deazaflavin:NADPH oxidoreductase
MKVTIIGAGNMGRGIGTRLVAGGNDVQVIDRDPAEAEALAEHLAAGAADGGSATATGPEGEVTGDVVVLAMYYPGVKDAVAEYADRLAGRVVVDITNPIDFETFDGLATPPDKSAAEEIAELVPSGTRVVKAFNTTFAGTLAAGKVADQQLDVLLAGDDEDAKRTVAALVTDGGMRPVDTGGLGRARELEALGLLHMGLQGTLGTGFGSTVKILA